MNNQNLCQQFISNEKDFPTHYRLENTKKVEGSVLCKHVRSIDYEIINLKFVEELSDNVLLNIVTLINTCIGE